jgi:hypothetical protein
MQSASTHPGVVLPAPGLLSRNTILALLVALLIGAGLAVGTYAVLDDEATVEPRVIVSTPVTPGEGTAAKNEAATAVAVAAAPVVSAGTAAKDEAATAASVGQQYGTAQYRPGVGVGGHQHGE